MIKKLIFAIIIVLALIFASLYIMNNDDSEVDVIVKNDTNIIYPSVEPSYALDVKAANNQLALDLYSIYSQQDGNVFYSPYSISSALSMTYEGAKGKTAEEMRSVLHLPESREQVRTEYKALFEEMNKPGKPYFLKTANALWAQKDYPFLDSYFKNVETYYSGKATNLDFIKDTENSRVTINDWVEEKTNDKIKDLIPKGVLAPETTLVLTNTLYFKGNWSSKFEAENTKEADFTQTNGEKIKVNMMHQTSYYDYIESEETQMIELNYLGDDLSMIVILPKEDIVDFEKTLTSDKIEKLKNSSKREKVALSLPKFKFETKYTMSKNLKAMGMPTAFDGYKADFTAMFDKSAVPSDENLYIDEVIHQTFIEVTEYGTEAAAATAVVMVRTTSVDMEEPKIFNANHPFIFIIQQKDTGNILFMGRVSTPTKV